MCFILCISPEYVCPDGWDRSLLTRFFQLCRFERKTRDLAMLARNASRSSGIWLGIC